VNAPGAESLGRFARFSALTNTEAEDARPQLPRVPGTDKRALAAVEASYSELRAEPSQARS
jgi:hypothetical protein